MVNQTHKLAANNVDVRQQVPLSSYTTLQVGGPAKYFVAARSVAELQSAIAFARANDLVVFILGHGSNVQVSDGGYAGLVIKNEIAGIRYQIDEDSVTAHVGAGVSLDQFIIDTVNRGYWGLENLSHIPGTVGATPVQNVGAYGVEVSQYILAVHAYNIDTHESKKFTTEECQFGYRDSYFKTDIGSSWCITAVAFILSIRPKPQLSYKDLTNLPLNSNQENIRNKVISIRLEKFPDWHTVGTAGSFFKNPIVPNDLAKQLQLRYPTLPVYPVGTNTSKISLGYILDKVCHLKGYAIGPVRLYEHQALVLVNDGGTTADIDWLVARVQATVAAATGIQIEREVRRI
jgi:UDP-N-acetylmuramate dehydrogenase